jgi:RimJ/RimL family protein N-acetyltransferase
MADSTTVRQTCDGQDGRPSGTEVLSGERIELRPIGPQEALGLRTHGTGGIDWVHDGPYDGTRDAAGMLVQAVAAGSYRPDWGVYAIVRRTDGLAVGGIGFHGPPQDGRVEIGYDLAVSARGHGYVTEALRLLAARALSDQEPVRVLEAAVEPGNSASERVLARCGFELVGTDGEGLLRYERRS